MSFGSVSDAILVISTLTFDFSNRATPEKLSKLRELEINAISTELLEDAKRVLNMAKKVFGNGMWIDERMRRLCANESGRRRPQSTERSTEE